MSNILLSLGSGVLMFWAALLTIASVYTATNDIKVRVAQGSLALVLFSTAVFIGTL